MFPNSRYNLKFDIQYTFFNRFKIPSLNPPEGKKTLYVDGYDINSRNVYMYAKFDIFYMFSNKENPTVSINP